MRYLQLTLVTLVTECGKEITGALKRDAKDPPSTIPQELCMLMPLQGHRNIVEVLACFGSSAQPTEML